VRISDQAAWTAWVDNNQDAYGKAIIEYAERWADAMEAAMDSGSSLEDCAKRTSHEADTEGLTGFMYGAAVSTLATSWVHGDQLRRWHNLHAQLGHEGERANEQGGVLNSALLIMRKADQ
jgi:hypothetical protein